MEKIVWGHGEELSVLSRINISSESRSPDSLWLYTVTISNTDTYNSLKSTELQIPTFITHL